MAAVVIAVVFLAVAGPGRSMFFSPGPLTNKHSELGACSTCHTAFDKGPTGWLHAAFAVSEIFEDSRNCLQCHKLGDQPFAPHSLDGDTIAALSKAAGDAQPSAGGPMVSAATMMFGNPMSESSDVACATCHREHHGADFELTHMSNSRCISCHQAKFERFAEGHPTFTNYPYDRRTRIAFDHTSHIDKHFKEGQYVDIAPKQCQSCHEADNQGELMLVKPFETVCASCHGAQVAGAGRAGPQGLAVLSPPGLDIIGLRDFDAAIGQWPELSEAEITPFMDFLLAQDADYVEARQILADVDMLDLSQLSDDQLGAIETLAWSVKNLLFDLRTEGASALQQRLETAFGRPLTSAERTDLVALMPRATIAVAQQEWFPDLLTEVPRHRAGERIMLPGDSEEEQEASTDTTGGDAASDGGDGSILGTDTGSSGSILGGDSDTGGSILGGDDKDTGGSILGDSNDSGGSILGGDDKDTGGSILGGSDDAGGSILGGDEDKGGSILGGGDAGGGSILGGDDSGGGSILGGDSDTGGSILGGLTGGSDDDRTVAVESLPEPAEVQDPESWMSAGGWYRDYFTLRYRPVGHADRFLSNWIDVTSKASKQPEARAIFEELTGDQAVGLCIKCHSVDAGPDDSLNINWYARRPVQGAKRFTRYSHTTHFSLMNEDGCLNCHVRDQEADFQASFKDRDPASFASNFVTIDKNFCANCHVPETAGDTCLTCHNYHIGTFPPAILNTDMAQVRAMRDGN